MAKSIDCFIYKTTQSSSLGGGEEFGTEANEDKSGEESELSEEGEGGTSSVPGGATTRTTNSINRCR